MLQCSSAVWQFRWPSEGLATETDPDKARGLALKKECRLVSRTSCKVPKFVCDAAAFRSSCDSVSPTTFRAGAEHPEGVTYTPREAPTNPRNNGHQPENWFAYAANSTRIFFLTNFNGLVIVPLLLPSSVLTSSQLLSTCARGCTQSHS